MHTTLRELESLVDQLNRETNSPQRPYIKDASGKQRAQIGNFHLSRAYAGIALHQISNDLGDTIDVFNLGHMAKPKLALLLMGLFASKHVIKWGTK